MEEKKQFIRDLRNKEEVKSTFLVKYISKMSARDGKTYINLIAQDSSGEIECRVWNNADEIMGRVHLGDYVQLQGKINVFQGKKQVIIEEISVLTKDQINEVDYIASSAHNPDEMFDKLLVIVNNLDDVYLRDLLKSILDDDDIQRRLKYWPAGKTIHHAYQSGLLEHILSCTQLSVWLSKHYHVNVNYVVAGAILHDLCKIYELTGGAVTEYTEEGKLVGHLVKILEVVDRFAYRIKGFPYYTKLHLKHILLSHHGEYAYGSPKIPMTAEAYLVHLIDLMDSKMHTIETLRKNDTTPGLWTTYIKHMDRIVFKGNLPHFTEYQDPNNDNGPTGGKKKSGKKPYEKEPTTSMGSLLKGFKVDD